jgi:F420-non-reducing hydrogenase iron-sulfur subunit
LKPQSGAAAEGKIDHEHDKHRFVRPGVNPKIKGDPKMSETFEPKILGFLCNWCAYAGGDLAGVSRLQYPPNMRAVRVMCSGMVHPDLVVEAFGRGADGVIVMG